MGHPPLALFTAEKGVVIDRWGLSVNLADQVTTPVTLGGPGRGNRPGVGAPDEHRRGVQVAEGPVRGVRETGVGVARGSGTGPHLPVRDGIDAVTVSPVGGAGPRVHDEGIGGDARRDPVRGGEPGGQALERGTARGGAGVDDEAAGGAGGPVPDDGTPPHPGRHEQGYVLICRTELQRCRREIDLTARSQDQKEININNTLRHSCPTNH